MTGLLHSIQIIDADDLAARVSMRDAIDAVQAVLRGGFDPADDVERTVVDVPGGQLLLMPAAVDGAVGQKLASVAPGNPAHGMPRIQAVYVLLDGATLTPTALLDGTALTTLRTPAVSAAVLDVLAVPDAASAVVIGTGPQGVAHVEAMAAIRPLRHVTFVGRDPAHGEQARDAVRRMLPDLIVDVRATADLPRLLPSADVVVCATTSSDPLFDDGLIDPHTAVVAVGSHEPTRRELPGPLMGRAQVVVESRRVAETEAGDVILAAHDACLDPAAVCTMADIMTGRTPVDGTRPRVLKTCGMGWQDLVVARLALRDRPTVKGSEHA